MKRSRDESGASWSSWGRARNWATPPLIALLVVLLSGCVQLTINGDNNTTMIMMSTMGTATIPVSAIPGLP